MADDEQKLPPPSLAIQGFAKRLNHLQATWSPLHAPMQLSQDILRETMRLHNHINSAHTDDFLEAVRLEAVHQVERWGADHDAGKEPADWLSLVCYLAAKCLAACLIGKREKALHHTISTAAALLNWHRAIKTGSSRMRPGYETPPA